jgi:hypothetical protein
MWPTWKALPTRWNQVMRVVLVAVVLVVSACAAPGRSTSTPGGFAASWNSSAWRLTGAPAPVVAGRLSEGGGSISGPYLRFNPRLPR